MLGRRRLLQAGGLALAGLAFRPACGEKAATIRMRSLELGAHVGFDPVGLWIAPGTWVRWIVESDVHTTTAYHPRYDDHPLRIPAAATPWDSDYLVNPGDAFEVRFDVEGVYDYFCRPHEIAGMVGRIVVGTPSGPGTLALDYHAADPATSHWSAIPPAASERFPSVASIMAGARRGDG